MFTIPLDNHSSIPLYRQIYHYIKNEIVGGTLSCHTKLPSTRSLALHLNVSRNTVDMAYSQLLSEGYIEAADRKGYFVSEIAFLAHIPSSLNVTSSLPAREENPYEYDFSPFAVDIAHFPYHTWRILSRNVLQDNRDLFLLGENQGDSTLRGTISSYLHMSRNVNCTKEQIVIGAGVDYLLQLLTPLLGEKPEIAMENPTYMRAYSIFKSLGCHITPVGLDRYGMDINELSDTSCSAAYVTPSHQYPMGTVMPIKRRIELLSWAYSGENRYIIEDDHDSEFRYKGKPVPSLQGIDSKERVIYIGTFSKAIAPAIRVGYMVLPRKLLEKYHQLLGFYSCTVSRIDQAILTEFINKGYFERHLNRMRKIYKEKHDTLLGELKTLIASSPDGSLSHMKITGENAGMHLVVCPDNGKTEQQLIAEARNKKIKLYGLSDHFITLPANYKPSLLIGYANLTEEEIKEGIQRLFSNPSSKSQT